jgi:hypothetical protein
MNELMDGWTMVLPLGSETEIFKIDRLGMYVVLCRLSSTTYSSCGCEYLLRPSIELLFLRRWSTSDGRATIWTDVRGQHTIDITSIHHVLDNLKSRPTDESTGEAVHRTFQARSPLRQRWISRQEMHLGIASTAQD